MEANGSHKLAATTKPQKTQAMNETTDDKTTPPPPAVADRLDGVVMREIEPGDYDDMNPQNYPPAEGVEVVKV